MALGLCCQWIDIYNGKPRNLLISRSLQLKRYKKGDYSREKIKQTYIANLQNLLDVMPQAIAAGIRVIRVSSSIFPLFDLVDRDLAENSETSALCAKIGTLSLEKGVRITTHPGQFTVISSDKADVVDKSLREIEYHAWMFDQMGLPKTPFYGINIHGGAGNRSERLKASIEQLSESAKNRLTLENCEFAYSVSQLESVARETEVPICFDSHHHSFNTGGLSGEEAMVVAMSTWPPGIRPMTHLSNSKPEYAKDAPPSKLRQHSDFLYYIPDYQRDANNTNLIDIEIEAKMKNLAIFKAVDDLNLLLS